MNREPWLERKYVIMMAKWWGVGTFISTAVISGIGFIGAIGYAKNTAQVTALVSVTCFVALLLLAYMRIYLPKLFRSMPPPKDLFFLRGVSLFFGWLAGSAVGLAIVTLLE